MQSQDMSPPKASLLVLPFEVLSAIWTRFSYEEICTFRKAIPGLSAAISSDKRLWSQLLEEFERQQTLIFPSFLRNVDEVNGSDIESWITHAIALKTELRMRDKRLDFRNIDVRRGLRATWLKLVLGSWCLVAAADEQESILYVFEIPRDGDPHLKARFHLEAPVIDGHVDWSSSQVICAITVGARIPYILIIGIYLSKNEVILEQLGRIPDASHVRYLKGKLLGFGVRGGDDTFPYVANWRTETLYCLQFPHDDLEIDSPLPLESCKAIIIEDGFIFTLHRFTLQIFEVPDENENCAPFKPAAKYLASLPFQLPVAVGRLMKPERRAYGDQAALRIVFEHEGGLFQQAVVEYDPRRRDFGAFSIHIFDMESRQNNRGLQLLHIGSSGRTLLCMTRQDDVSYLEIPSLYLLSLQPSSNVEETSPSTLDGGFSQISTSGFPFLHLVSCIDFDDGYGIILIGNLLGTVRLASFLPHPAINPGSTRTMNSISHLQSDRFMLLKDPVALDLPPFYEVRKNRMDRNRIPQDLLTLVLSEWEDSRIGTLTLAKWSNDWLNFKYVYSWLQPLSRWGPLDEGFSFEFASTEIRHRLQILGEIKPVLYCLESQAEVVFRVGQRMYYSMLRTKGDDVNLFEFYDDGYLGVLPITYGQFANNPQEIIPVLSHVHAQTNLALQRCPRSLRKRTGIAGLVYSIINHQKVIRDAPLERNEIESWTTEKWRRYLEMLPETSSDDESSEEDDNDEDRIDW